MRVSAGGYQNKGFMNGYEGSDPEGYREMNFLTTGPSLSATT